MTGKHLYRSRRLGNRVRRRYLGMMSDPCVELVGRTRRFDRMTRKTFVTKRRHEAEQSRDDEVVLKQLTESHMYWPVLDVCSWRLDQASLMQSLNTPGKPSDRLQGKLFKMFPKKREFARLVRAADEGDPDAQARLTMLLRQFPQVVADMTNLVEIAKRQVIESMAGDSFTAQTAVAGAIDHTVESLVPLKEDNPIARMYAEIVAITCADAKRCSMASLREHSNHREASFWSAQANRATRRFDRVMEAFQAFQVRHTLQQALIDPNDHLVLIEDPRLDLTKGGGRS